ncbi:MULTISPECIES: hypothetical protein [unclassified Streptomyces]|uniref:hypothetical protein n=1 Tax=unclassified Streptomyces TaxID=2593676 RepID=UPI002E7FB7A7|nr:hypothetical protein [Streptomyces sp. NBC_00589]WTI33879.1 hypothetical protein OIC96_02205 [Streptomyces sp. NBC_00775]WUB32448.1 hypothetical protein OHA51_47525 [Streptomyces sp. NBC_00589]
MSVMTGGGVLPGFTRARLIAAVCLGLMSATLTGCGDDGSPQAGASTRWFTGQRTEHTDVGTTTTWMEARLVVGTDRSPRLDLIRAATLAMRAVVNCQEFTSTSSTAQRISLTLSGE